MRVSAEILLVARRGIFLVKSQFFCPNFWEIMSIMRDEIDNFESIVLTHIR